MAGLSHERIGGRRGPSGWRGKTGLPRLVWLTEVSRGPLHLGELLLAAARLVRSPSTSPSQPRSLASAIRSSRLSMMRWSRSCWSGSGRSIGQRMQACSCWQPDPGHPPAGLTGQAEARNAVVVDGGSARVSVVQVRASQGGVARADRASFERCQPKRGACLGRTGPEELTSRTTRTRRSGRARSRAGARRRCPRRARTARRRTRPRRPSPRGRPRGPGAPRGCRPRGSARDTP